MRSKWTVVLDYDKENELFFMYMKYQTSNQNNQKQKLQEFVILHHLENCKIPIFWNFAKFGHKRSIGLKNTHEFLSVKCKYQLFKQHVNEMF